MDNQENKKIVTLPYRVDDLVKEQIRKILLSLVIFKYTKKIVGNKIFVLWYLNYLRL